MSCLLSHERCCYRIIVPSTLLLSPHAHTKPISFPSPAYELVRISRPTHSTRSGNTPPNVTVDESERDLQSSRQSTPSQNVL
mmetsp:Transcript_13521/g.17015  ORF Transcript_13521/g.17015 Transcript_13521/m.17015 type:complete len:82 (+) Transcript_13521:210-455(+)